MVLDREVVVVWRGVASSLYCLCLSVILSGLSLGEQALPPLFLPHISTAVLFY